MLQSSYDRLKKLPVSSEEYVETELAAARKRTIQGILPPGYTALDDGSVVGPDGKVVVYKAEVPPVVPYHPV